MYQQIVLPGYAPVIEALRHNGVETICLITYANARVLLPAALAAGFDCLWACEANMETMDYLALRREWPRLKLIGGIDLDALLADEAAVKREMEHKVPALLAQGGISQSPTAASGQIRHTGTTLRIGGSSKRLTNAGIKNRLHQGRRCVYNTPRWARSLRPACGRAGRGTEHSGKGLYARVAPDRGKGRRRVGAGRCSVNATARRGRYIFLGARGVGGDTRRHRTADDAGAHVHARRPRQLPHTYAGVLRAVPRQSPELRLDAQRLLRLLPAGRRAGGDVSPAAPAALRVSAARACVQYRALSELSSHAGGVLRIS